MQDEKDYGTKIYGTFVCLDNERIFCVDSYHKLFRAIDFKNRKVLSENRNIEIHPDNYSNPGYSYKEDSLYVTGNQIVYVIKEAKRVIKDEISGSTKNIETGRRFYYRFNIDTYELEEFGDK